MVGIAQLARAPDCGSGGQGFNSLYPPQEIIGLSSSGKTQHFDCCIRGFESRQPSHYCLKFNIIYVGDRLYIFTGSSPVARARNRGQFRCHLNCPIFMRFLSIFEEIRVGSKQ